MEYDFFPNKKQSKSPYLVGFAPYMHVYYLRAIIKKYYIKSNNNTKNLIN
jgi:hypothetical protein